jgi:hypothetical protein
MDEYREMARKRYMIKQQEQEEQDEENRKVEEEKKRVEEEAQRYLDKQEQNKEFMIRVLEEWDTMYHSLSHDTLLTLHLMCTLMEPTIPLFKEMDNMKEWETRVVQVIHELDTLQQTRRSSMEEVRELEYVIKHMITLANIEVDIKLMDTTNDELVANQLAEQEWKQELDFLHPMNMMPVMPPLENDPDELPIVSLKRRIGLTLQQLKEMARFRGQKMTGSKEELCIRLAQAGWVRIVD